MHFDKLNKSLSISKLLQSAIANDFFSSFLAGVMLCVYVSIVLPRTYVLRALICVNLGWIGVSQVKFNPHLPTELSLSGCFPDRLIATSP